MRYGRKQGHPVRAMGRAVAIAAAIAATLAAPAAALAEGATLYRLYNPYDGQHLLTTDRGEYDSLQPLGWRGEGEAWESPDEGDPVYRLYNPYNGEHLYTGDEAEYDSLARIGWRQEGVAFRSQASGGDPVYRLFNPYEQVGTHLLTTSASEYESLAGAGWVQEGVAFRAAHTHDWQPVYESVWVQDSAVRCTRTSAPTAQLRSRSRQEPSTTTPRGTTSRGSWGTAARPAGRRSRRPRKSSDDWGKHVG